jgi:regulatory protein YycI of two-component signal transduction system YycFG
MKVVFAQSMLLSKALKMQQDLEDKKHEVIIEGLESKIKDHAAALEKKDFELQTVEGLLAEAEAKIAKLNSELLSKSKRFKQEKKVSKQNSKPKLKKFKYTKITQGSARKMLRLRHQVHPTVETSL